MRRFLFTITALCCGIILYAQTISADLDNTDRTYHVVELRQSAGADFKLGKSGSIGISEEIREVIFDSAKDPVAYFSKSYTTIEGGWKFLSLTDAYNGYKYGMKLSAGYTLRYLQQKLHDSSGNVQDPSYFLRHRPYVVLSASVNFGTVKLTLRERFLADYRADSVNLLEKPQWNMELRHRLTADFTIPGRTYKPFTSIEFANTLNQPSLYDTSGTKLYGGQYLCAVRARAGVRWRLNQQNTLTFSYGFHFTQGREVNITKKSQEINRLYMEKTLRHVITVAYEFGM